MKEENQVKQKFKQVVFRHRKNYLQTHLRVLPSNCIHNRIVKSIQGQAVKICGLRAGSQDWTTALCDEAHGGEVHAAECPDFTSKTPEELKQEFRDSLENASDLARIAKLYPDIVALIWVMGTSPEHYAQEIGSMFEDEDAEG